MKLAYALLISVCLISVGFARYEEQYTFDKLFEMSDLVVLIEHKSTERTEDKGEAQNGGEGLLTTAQIIGTLKGSCPSKTITIRHFRYDGPKSEPIEGVRFPGFDETGRIVEACTTVETPAAPYRAGAFFRPPWRYIAFLKRQDERLYVPILPQDRSVECFYMLVSSGGFMGVSAPLRPAQSPGPVAASSRFYHENYKQAEVANPAEQSGAGQPATKLADKVPVEAQPSPSSVSQKNASNPLPPAGMITAIRENAAWKFRIRVQTGGYNFSTSVKTTLNGKDIPSSLCSPEPTSDYGVSYMNVSLSDEIVKTGVLELWDSRRSNFGDEGTIHYTIQLAELTK